jgi:hypothetical protein
MIKSYSLVLAVTAKRVSDAFGDGAGVVTESKNIPFRQLIFTASGADGYLGDSTVTTTTGIKVGSAAGSEPISIGPFDTGPVKLADLYAIGSGATLQILGVPY